MAYLALSACEGVRPTPASGSDTWPAGSAMDERTGYQLAIYYLPTPEGDPEALFQGHVAASGFVLSDEPENEATGRIVSARLVDDLTDYAPPDEDSLQYFGRGLSDDQGRALQSARQALIVDVLVGREHFFTGLRDVVRIVGDVARRTGGLVWDEETREVFTPDAWEERRLEGWREGVPDVSRHVVIHSYLDGEYRRAISLGMVKFGLPDIVVEGYGATQGRSVGHLVNLLAQALAEGAEIGAEGRFDLALHDIRERSVREPQEAALLEGATGTIPLLLRPARRDDGDPENRLVEITFGRVRGRDEHARIAKALADFFGSHDSIVDVSHDDEELMAASERARGRLEKLREAFQEGLAPREVLEVKAPFDVPDGGHEYMWVEVTAWEGSRIRGLLTNEPFRIPTLQAGQAVEVSQDDVFDYLHRLPDGTSEGNETGAIISRLAGGSE